LRASSSVSNAYDQKTEPLLNEFLPTSRFASLDHHVFELPLVLGANPTSNDMGSRLDDAADDASFFQIINSRLLLAT
jgi:hypothetical protein